MRGGLVSQLAVLSYSNQSQPAPFATVLWIDDVSGEPFAFQSSV